MEESLFSPHWYRIAGLKPRIRSHVSIHRHRYRGERWFVLQDHASSHHHRLNQAAYQFIGLFNGMRSVQEAWDIATEKLGDDGPTQDEAINMISQLHTAQMVEVDLSPDIEVLFHRQKTREKRRRNQRMFNPLVMRIPLHDPDYFLNRLAPWFEPLFSKVGITVWMLLVSIGLIVAGMHWPELSSQPLAEISEPGNLLLLVLLYPCIKFVHEIAHGLTIKHWGGEVHEIGITLLVFMPVPYVDASAANTLPNKWQRALVSAAGMICELAIAAVAMLIWVNLEPGILRDIIFNIILISSVSTLFFNGNPLMRFDAYYILADIIEIPDLWKRSRQYYQHLAKRYLLGIQDQKTFSKERHENLWLLGYGALSWTYMMLILIGLVLIISDISQIAGFLLAVWIVVMQIVVPLTKGVQYVRDQAPAHSRRTTAIVAPVLLLSLLLVALFGIPVSHYTRAQGVIWTPEKSRILAGADCLVRDQLLDEGNPVSAGDVVVNCNNQQIDMDIRILQARVRELRAQYDGYDRRDRIKRQVAADELRSVRAELARLYEQQKQLKVVSPMDGHFYTLQGDLLQERFFAQGTQIGYVLQGGPRTIRAVIEQDQIGLFDNQPIAVQVRLSESVDKVVQGTGMRIVPGAEGKLPSKALNIHNGGQIAVRLEDPDGLITLQTVYQVEASIPGDEAISRVGGRVYLRFEHAPIPLGQQWLRSLRQLFLGKMVF